MPGVPFGRPSTRWLSVRHRAAAEGSTKMSKSSKKVVVFSLTMPKTEIPFAELSTTLKKFGKMRADFEQLAVRVEVVDLKA